MLEMITKFELWTEVEIEFIGDRVRLIDPVMNIEVKLERLIEETRSSEDACDLYMAIERART